jgi:YVTN family beta-propeller protein
MKHIVLVATILLTGCIQDPASVEPVVPVPSAKGVYILNEGTWGRGNSTLSYYDLESFKAYNDVYGTVNGVPIGDVGNQVVLRNDRGYIVVNNSDRIEIFDLATTRNVGTLSLGGGKSPRQMAFADDSIALLTASYDNSVLVLNVRSLSVLQRIPVGDNPEGIAITRGKAYVANSGFGAGKTVSVIDVTGRSVLRTIPVGDNPNGVVVSEDGMVWVVCAGSYDFSNPANDTPAKLKVIDPVSDQVIDSVFIGPHAYALAIGPDGRGYIAAATEVMTIDLRARRVVGTFQKGYYYSAGVEYVSGDVYLTDPKGFLGPGEVLVYAANGQLRNRFTAGVIPGSIAFKR